MNVRSFWRNAVVDNIDFPYNVIQYNVMYKALVAENKLGGRDPVDESNAPFPVVIFFGGAFCVAQMYQTLAIELVRTGFVVMTYNWVTENPKNSITLSPGVDISACLPQNYGQRATSLSLPTLLKELEKINSDHSEILADKLDLTEIVLGGHSLGGRIAIENANRKFFPQVKAAFSYGSDLAAYTYAGYQPQTILSIEKNTIPLLMLGGNNDGVISYMSRNWSGFTLEDSYTTLIKTFKEGLGEHNKHLVIVDKANHFSIADFVNPTMHASSVDITVGDEMQHKFRSHITSLIRLFLQTYILNPENNLEIRNEFFSVSSTENTLNAISMQK